MTRWSARAELLDNPPDFLALRSAHRQSLGASRLREGIPLLDSTRRRSRMSPVRCTNCQSELGDGKKFCHACGAPAAQRCAHCGAQVGPEFRFCPDCGQPLVAEPSPAPVEDRLTRHIPANLAAKI